MPLAQAVASLLLGAAKLQRAIKVAAREAEGTGYEGLAPITAAFKVRHDEGGPVILKLSLFAVWHWQRDHSLGGGGLVLSWQPLGCGGGMIRAPCCRPPVSAGRLDIIPTRHESCLQHHCTPLQNVVTLPELAGAIGSAIEESGAVRESASDEVRRARGRVRTIEGRLRGILKVSAGAAL